jgi:hypothetical protein
MIASDYASMYSHERCRHRTPAGRQCSAVVTDQRYPYCHRHVPLQPSDSEDLSGPLTEHACQFLNAQGINYSLSALYHLLASGKISPRRAGTLAYISSLLLHSLTAIDTDRHPNAGAEDPNEKPASVYQSEAQWALATLTPPIVPRPTDSRLQSNPVPATQQTPVPVESQENITMHHLDHAPCTAASSLC